MLFNFNKRSAIKLHQQAQVLSEQGRDDEAIELYLQAIEKDPGKSESFYNIGLIYKYQNEWELSFEYNQKASFLDPGDEAARWNLAIAATALRRWDVVRSAWRQQGIELDGTDGPIEMNMGITPVRLNPDDDGEVVWATRVDPVRARIDSVPFPDSGFNYGDIVLHDGAAVGYRQLEGREYPVFNVLELFSPSGYETLVVKVQVPSDADLICLQGMFDGTSHEFEDWTKNIRVLCKECSEGVPHEHNDNEPSDSWCLERTLGVATLDHLKVTAIFDEWQKKTRGQLLSLEVGSGR